MNKYIAEYHTEPGRILLSYYKVTAIIDGSPERNLIRTSAVFFVFFTTTTANQRDGNHII